MLQYCPCATMWGGFYDVFSPADKCAAAPPGSGVVGQPGAASSSVGKSSLQHDEENPTVELTVSSHPSCSSRARNPQLAQLDAKLIGRVGKQLHLSADGVVSGSTRGTVYGKYRIEQDKLYYEVEILRAEKKNHSTPSKKARLFLGLTNTVAPRGTPEETADDDLPARGHGCEVEVEGGDIFSCTYDQANYPTFNIYQNASLVESVTGMKGQLIPYVSFLDHLHGQLSPHEEDGGERGDQEDLSTTASTVSVPSVTGTTAAARGKASGSSVGAGGSAEIHILWRFHDVRNKEAMPDFANFDKFMTARSVI
ncbi:unnamed protein product [Amoebophrya sp. A120]|nr:unnamed protein product [Amoebophrya sp. A120]|eukprot:GSA120T00026114001.1